MFEIITKQEHNNQKLNFEASDKSPLDQVDEILKFEGRIRQILNKNKPYDDKFPGKI